MEPGLFDNAAHSLGASSPGHTHPSTFWPPTLTPGHPIPYQALIPFELPGSTSTHWPIFPPFSLSHPRPVCSCPNLQLRWLLLPVRVRMDLLSLVKLSAGRALAARPALWTGIRFLRRLEHRCHQDAVSTRHESQPRSYSTAWQKVLERIQEV